VCPRDIRRYKADRIRPDDPPPVPFVALGNPVPHCLDMLEGRGHGVTRLRRPAVGIGTSGRQSGLGQNPARRAERTRRSPVVSFLVAPVGVNNDPAVTMRCREPLRTFPSTWGGVVIDMSPVEPV
jgi:hypothetical protein